MDVEYKTAVRTKNAYEKELELLPEGTLRCWQVNGSEYLCWRRKDKDQYLSRSRPEDMRIANDLVRKAFLKESLRGLKEKIKSLEKMRKIYVPHDPVTVSENLSAAYQIPEIREREALPCFYPQRAEEMPLRSKAEKLIAVVLQSRGLEMQYEREIMADGVAMRPDFTIRHPKTNELIYYEHFGLVDKEDYYRIVTRKLMLYWHEGIRLGDNLIATFETKERPLDIVDVERELDRVFGER